MVESFVLSHIVEGAYAQGWGVYVPRNWGKRCAPYRMLYLKHKSCEAIGYIKSRPIISHAGHPLQRLGTRMSRALSVLVDRLASMPENSEAFTMPDVLQHFCHVHDSMSNRHGDTSLLELGEIDLEDKFLNIDKRLLLESFDYLIERLDHFAPPGNGRYLSRCKSVRFVSISTIDKKFDRLHRAPGMDTYHYILVATLRYFVDSELRLDNLFCAGGYVMSQHRGVPMRGKLSSQLSSLFLMCKEMHNTRLSMFGDSVFYTRYKDNIYVCGPPGSVFPFIQEWCDSLSELYTMPVQVEGFGYQMDVLESTIYVTGNGLSMQVRCKTLDQAT